MIKKTITTIFMVPTLKIPKNLLNNNGFINGYLKDSNKDLQYVNVVYILFRPKDLDKFREFLEGEYERTKDIIEDYDYPDGYVVVVYKLDLKYEKDFNIIKTGKYSKTSKTFQQLFPKIVTLRRGKLNQDEISLQYRIFNKTEDLISFWEEKLGIDFLDRYEVWHGFDENEEILDITKIKDYVEQEII